jgi:zinc transporter 2
LGLYLSQHAASADYTYGFKQAEVLGACFSILIVWLLTVGLLYTAVQRILYLEPLDAPAMFVISLIGFVVNLVLMKVLGHNHSHGGEACTGHGGTGDSIAMQAAIAHVIGDIVQSLGVCLAAVLIWWQPFDVGYTDAGVTKWTYADPACTVLFGFLVLNTTKSTIRNGMNILMVKAPKHIDQALMLQRLQKIESVDHVHDLHVWSLGSSVVLCTAHVMITCGEHQTRVLKSCIKVAQELGIGHSTFQIEIKGEFDPALETFGGLKCRTGDFVDSRPHGGGDDCCGGHDHGRHGDAHSHDGHSHG